MSHGLIYMVGPSGVGKDSLLAWLSQRPHSDFTVPLHIARRSITRPEDGGTEVHEALTEQAFSDLEAANGFAMRWEAKQSNMPMRSHLADLILKHRLAARDPLQSDNVTDAALCVWLSQTV